MWGGGLENVIEKARILIKAAWPSSQHEKTLKLTTHVTSVIFFMTVFEKSISGGGVY